MTGPAPHAIDPLLTASMELGRDGLAVPPAFCRLSIDLSFEAA